MNTLNTNGMENGHSYVDLGLPSGLLWATCNVGADSPEQAGLYFAWGETKGFSEKQLMSEERKFIRSTYLKEDISDNLTLENDAAHVNMGGSWRMPTMEEFDEVVENCDSYWVENFNESEMSGTLFTSKFNGKSVFFPAAGGCISFNLVKFGFGFHGNYWSSQLCDEIMAEGFGFKQHENLPFLSYRYFASLVRGVCNR